MAFQHRAGRRSYVLAGFVAISLLSACSDTAQSPDGKLSDGGTRVADSGPSGPTPDARRSDGGTSAGTPDATGAPDAGGATGGGVLFSLDVTRGPARQVDPPALPEKVSSYVYGINVFGVVASRKTQFGLVRAGGDSYTTYNWTTNTHNTGADYCFGQFQGAGGSTIAGDLASGSSSIPSQQARGSAFLATLPIVESVASSFLNNTGINNLCPVNAPNCDGSPNSGNTRINSNHIDFASVNPQSTAFVQNKSTKPGPLCTCLPGASCASGCAIATSGTVYADELVNYIQTTFGASGKPPIFWSLDNEPNYWGGTHPEVWPFTGTSACPTATITYDDIVSRNQDFAAAVKRVAPAALVFGPVVAQDGLLYAHSYGSDPHHDTEFLDYYLAQMATAARAGHPLLDVLDVHYYNPGGGSTQCVQNPRMFWDPGYTSLSASATDAIDFGWSGLNDDFDTKWYPRQLVPRLLRKIAAAYGNGAAPKLAISEYNSGCETEIAGAVGQADNLGIFGREGVYAATAWPLAGYISADQNYLISAFEAYRNYDGNGAVVGDLAIRATTSDAAKSSVYAFVRSDDASAIDLVALNKTSAALTATIRVAGAPALTKVTVYQLVSGRFTMAPVAGAPPVSCAGGSCTVSYALPPMSVTTMLLRP